MLIDVAGTEDIPEGEARRFVVNRIEIAVANLGSGTFLAVDDICSHAEASLSEGEVDVDMETIECPRHGSTFDLRTGQPKTLPATVPIPTFPVKVDGERILIELEG
jgi:3-phenylpropionate/trans-cinnamate dioxygenase ferredoxin component